MQSSNNETKNQENSECLPSITNRTYSTCKRPRRNTQSKIPERFWDSFIRCVEYPDGIYINKYGEAEPNAFQDDKEEEDTVSDDEFEKLHPAKKQKILHTLKRLQQKEEQEERINLEYDKVASEESYDNKDLVIDPDFIAHMKGDEEYVPSSEDSESEIEYDSQQDEEESCSDGQDSSEFSDEESTSDDGEDEEGDEELCSDDIVE